MTTTTTDSAAPGPAAAPQALPFLGSSRTSFTVHAALALALLATLNWMIAAHAPESVKQIGSSYLIVYYHVPSAILSYLAYFGVFLCGIFHLVTNAPEWDRRARASAAIGLLATGVVVVTGAVWGKAAWNVWWRFDDPRLTTSAVLFLIYLAYIVLARGIEDETKRSRTCAIYGIAAFLAVPLVHFSIQWFGQGSHPPKVAMAEPGIRDTLNMGIFAFLALYSLLYRWKFDLDSVRERADAALQRIRRLEDLRS